MLPLQHGHHQDLGRKSGQVAHIVPHKNDTAKKNTTPNHLMAVGVGSASLGLLKAAHARNPQNNDDAVTPARARTMQISKKK